MSNQTELESGSYMALPMVHLDFDGDPVYAFGGRGTVAWSGQTWTGLGALGTLGKIKEDAKAGLQTITLSLHGFDDEDAGGDSSALTALKTVNYRGRDAFVYLGLFEEDGQTLVAGTTPDLRFAGPISALTAQDTRGAQAIEISIDSYLTAMNRRTVSYLSDQEHQRYNPADLFFDHVYDALNKVVYWGLGVVGGRGGTSSGGGGEFDTVAGRFLRQ